MGQVGAHVRAVRIQEADVALAVGKGDQACAEDIQGVQLAITVVSSIPQAVPTAGVAVRALGIFDA
ncbi:hypothetical protein D3C84_906950 [compost metagenome]